MPSIILSRYLEIWEGGDNLNMCDKKIMEVVTDMTKTSKAIGLKTDSIAQIAFIGLVEGAGRIRAISIDIRTTSKFICASLADRQAPGIVDAVELYDDYNISIGDWNSAHYALVC